MISHIWRDDIDALRFVAPNGALCFVHRLAFRVLVGKPPTANECLAFFEENMSSFFEAALLRSACLPEQTLKPFHLNSREIRRELRDSKLGSQLA